MSFTVPDCPNCGLPHTGPPCALDGGRETRALRERVADLEAAAIAQDEATLNLTHLLRARAERAEQAHHDLVETMKGVTAMSQQKDADLARVTAERDRLRAALGRFGHHSSKCVAYYSTNNPNCDCGLRAALEGR